MKVTVVKTVILRISSRLDPSKDLHVVALCRFREILQRGYFEVVFRMTSRSWEPNPFDRLRTPPFGDLLCRPELADTIGSHGL